MLHYIGSAVWRCPLGARPGDGEDQVTGSVAALARAAGQAIRRRPWASAALLSLLALLGTGAGAQLYALHLRAAARAALKEGRPAEAQRDLAFCLKVWPRSIPTLLLAARADRMTGNIPEAEAHLHHCLKLNNGPSED